eukprot:TRINITY_DN18_c0_g1_i7.p1 TRINITY_DN18_c0_g1~~TRINITY_DN18_c0_g1_i7.p1  ORF type:complete len:247 (-),score=38.39 TRINITY_DN18_c0_g1_i7:105-845(-)
MEECEEAYQRALTPAVSVMEPTMTTTSCSAADGYWVNGALSGLVGYDSTTMTVCQDDGEYKIQLNDGTVYSTCVAYGNPGDDCTNPDLVCPEHPVNPGPGKFGYGGNVRARLASALTRNDFKHPSCPTSECRSMDELAQSNTYWADTVQANGYTTVTVEQTNNIVVCADSSLQYITREGMYNTCLGWSDSSQTTCDSGKFMCAGSNGQGLFAFGWPGQIARALAKAVDNSAGNYMHPQCPLNICAA